MPHRKSKSNFPPEAQVTAVQIPPEFRAEAGFELLRSLSNTGERSPLRQLSKKEVRGARPCVGSLRGKCTSNPSCGYRRERGWGHARAGQEKKPGLSV